MDSIKIRKYSYKIQVISENILENLKSIQCKYHIIGFKTISEVNNEKSVMGFIYFVNPRRIKSVKQILKLENVIPVEDDSEQITNQILELEDVWEKGELPKKSKITPKKNDTASNSIHYMCAFIMKQHQQLIEDTMNQRNQLMQENIKLRETATQIQQTNIQKLENTMNMTNSNIVKNSNNKTFNINVFLNEDCKNAITLVDFVKTLQVENEDLVYAKDHGFAEAVTRILENGLKKYDLTSRPLHCSDIKRETMHIKEEAGWVKEKGSESDNLNKAIRSISKKKMDKVVDYLEENADCKIGSRKYDDNFNIMQKIAEGATYTEKYNKKIVKNIVKSVHLNEESIDA